MKKSKKQQFKAIVWNMAKTKQITHAAHKVLMVLAGHATIAGCFPNHDTLAAEAGVSRRTVIRSLEAAYALGLVERTRRVVRKGTLLVRGSNLYRLVVAKAEIAKMKAEEVMKRARDAVKQRTFAFLEKLSDRMSPDTQKHNYNNGLALTPQQWIERLEEADRADRLRKQGCMTELSAA